MHRTRGFHALVGAFLLLSGSIPAQVAWMPVDSESLLSRQGHALAWDEHRQRLVLHAAVEDPRSTPSPLEWDEGTWRPHFPSQVPVVRTEEGSPVSLAYFPPRRRSITFAAEPDGLLWEWDGQEWEPIRDDSGPPAWRGHALTYDQARQCLVLFGGRKGEDWSNETWTWDGRQWTLHQPTLAPLPRTGAGLVHDANHGRTILFGGCDEQGDLGDTWEWNGSRWKKHHLATAPAPRHGHSMAYDPRNRLCFLFGGRTTEGDALDDTWAWDGRRWFRLEPFGRPTARSFAALAHVPPRSALVLTGGVDRDGRTLADCFTFDGTTWKPCRDMAPAPRSLAGFAYDPHRGRAVLSGGVTADGEPSAETWIWDGGRWDPAALEAAPSAEHALAWDGVSQELVRFGTGPDGTSQTKGFAGGKWAPRKSRRHPSSRRRHAMASDPNSGHVILFGGRGCHGDWMMNDTWEWDGYEWSQRFPAHSPEARCDHAMTYDASLGGIVLGPGEGSSSTYLWNGHDWVRLADLPRIVRGARMAHDGHRGRTVLFGGVTPTGRVLDETWELTTQGWHRARPHGTLPSARHGHAMAFDAQRRRIVLHGGFVDSEETAPLGDTWILRPVRDAKLYPFGDACEGSFGLPILAPVNGDVPWMGDRFRVEVAPFVPPALLILGADRHRIERSAHLPLDLTFLGLQGCDLLVEPLIFVPMQGRIHEFEIPNRPTLIGAFFYQQAMVTDPSASDVKAVLSQGLVGRVGSR